MSTQLKTRPPASRTVEAPTKPQQPAVHVSEMPPGPRLSTAWAAVIVVVVVVALSLVAINMLSDDTASSAPEYLPAFDSPGGNSLNLPVTGADAYVPAFDSPGGNSLNTVPAVALVLSFEGPGGHSLNIP